LERAARPGLLAGLSIEVFDVGANRGYYSYALSRITDTVDAFEPNPVLADFARKMLGPKVTIHEVALSNYPGVETFYIPQMGPGVDVHFNASLKKPYSFDSYVETQVRVASLDEFAFLDVGFIKIDVEGSDMDVIEGGRETIARNRPNMVVELIAITHAHPLACIEKIKGIFDYDAWIMVRGHLMEARAALCEPLPLKTFNVVFTPK
jgi:FkbM family methyltransferase